MKKILFSMISIIVLTFSIVFIFSSKDEFSETENRYLQTMPKFSLKNIKSGKFISELEDFITDTFPLRDTLVGIKTKCEKLIGKKDINEVYLGKDSFMLTKYNKIDTTKLKKMLNEFQKNNLNKNINLMLVPSSITIYKDKLPKYAITDSEIDVINDIYQNVNIKSIDVYSTLMKLKETKEVFYKTDHHWTTYGAYNAYIEYCKKNNLIPKDTSYFDITNVTNNFYGTLYSKTNNYDAKADTITLFKTKTNYIVEYPDGTIKNSLYEDSYLDKKDKYSVFLNNNHSLLTITNKDINSNDAILVIKDSYGNSFVPFIAEHYKKIYVIDLRYNLSSMSEFIEKNDINNILILYNINTIDDNSSIYYLR